MKRSTAAITANVIRTRPLVSVDPQAAATTASGKIRDGAPIGQTSLDRKYSKSVPRSDRAAAHAYFGIWHFIAEIEALATPPARKRVSSRRKLMEDQIDPDRREFALKDPSRSPRRKDFRRNDNASRLRL